MPLNAIFGASFGVAVGAAATYGYLQSRQRAAPSPVTVSPTALPRAHPALKFGVPIKERVRVFEDHVVGYDPALRNPIWVLEHLNRAKAYGDVGRSKEFVEDAVCLSAEVRV